MTEPYDQPMPTPEMMEAHGRWGVHEVVGGEPYLLAGSFPAYRVRCSCGDSFIGSDQSNAEGAFLTMVHVPTPWPSGPPRSAAPKPWYVTRRSSWWNTTCLLVWLVFRRRRS